MNERNDTHPTMTAEEAQSFARYSPQNATTVRQSLLCGCRPYQDVYTYNRWLAQGMQVQRGQHAIRLPVIREVDEVDEDGPTGQTRRIVTRAPVFCRCQVKPVRNHRERERQQPAYPRCQEPGHLYCGARGCNGERARDCGKPEPLPIGRTRPQAEPAAAVDAIMTGWKVV